MQYTLFGLFTNQFRRVLQLTTEKLTADIWIVVWLLTDNKLPGYHEKTNYVSSVGC